MACAHWFLCTCRANLHANVDIGKVNSSFAKVNTKVSMHKTSWWQSLDSLLLLFFLLWKKIICVVVSINCWTS